MTWSFVTGFVLVLSRCPGSAALGAPGEAPLVPHSRLKNTGPQHASVGVPSAARTSSHRARLPTA